MQNDKGSDPQTYLRKLHYFKTMVSYIVSSATVYNVKQMKQAYQVCHRNKTALDKSVCYAKFGFIQVKDIRKIEQYVPVITKLETECEIHFAELVENK